MPQSEGAGNTPLKELPRSPQVGPLATRQESDTDIRGAIVEAMTHKPAAGIDDLNKSAVLGGLLSGHLPAKDPGSPGQVVGVDSDAGVGHADLGRVPNATPTVASRRGYSVAPYAPPTGSMNLISPLSFVLSIIHRRRRWLVPTLLGLAGTRNPGRRRVIQNERGLAAVIEQTIDFAAQQATMDGTRDPRVVTAAQLLAHWR